MGNKHRDDDTFAEYPQRMFRGGISALYKLVSHLRLFRSGIKLLDDVELVCIALAADTVERNRVHWVHPLNALRITLGEFHCLYSNLRRYPDRFFNYYRMSIKSFDELVISLRPCISETAQLSEKLLALKNG
ncbi:hypothetical protein QTP88_029015 [Uroleucon formosanum]